MAVQTLDYSTGEEQTQGVWKAIENWNLQDKVRNVL